MRFEIPAYTDRWMMGDRFGDLVRTYQRRTGKRTYMAEVKLDKSGKTVRFPYDDCRCIDVYVAGDNGGSDLDDPTNPI